MSQPRPRGTDRLAVSCRPAVERLEDRSVPASVAGGDFNGDGVADLAVGVPAADVGSVTGAGVVRVWYGSAAGFGGDSQVWSQNTSGIHDTAEAGDRFGAAVAAGDFNDDGRDDLVVGVPSEDVGSATDGGVTHVIYGSATGLTSSGNQRWLQGSSGIVHRTSAGDQFGAAVVTGDFNGDRRADLVVGMPYNRAGGTDITGAGGVVVIYGSPTGLTSSGNRAFDSEEQGVLGDGQRNEHYGAALAAGDFNRDGRDDLAVGIPDKDAPGAADAGAVNVLYGSSFGLTPSNDLLLWQGAGLPDAAEAGDRVGAALAAADLDGDGRDDLVAAAPTEDLAAAADAGAVAVVFGSATGLTSARSQFWTQDAAGGPDPGEGGDRFGAAVTAGDFDGDGHADLAVAAPGDDLGVEDAGVVHVLRGSVDGPTADGGQWWSQDAPGVRGVAEAGDRFGAALATADFNGDGRPDLAADVPGELSGAGGVAVLYGSETGLSDAGNQLLVWAATPPPAPVTLVAAGSTWRYLDTGVDAGTAWREPGFDDSAWASGAAQLGYGDGDEATVVGFGPRSSRKYVTTYFRHTFTVADPAAYGGLTLRLLRDDGAVVYVNGVEVFRSNMPGGDITATTLASSAVGGADESRYFEATVSAGVLLAGVNVVAVEVHQATADSSDLGFDLELTATPVQSATTTAALTLEQAPTLNATSTADGESHQTEAASSFDDPTSGQTATRTAPTRRTVRLTPPAEGSPAFPTLPGDDVDVTADGLA